VKLYTNSKGKGIFEETEEYKNIAGLKTMFYNKKFNPFPPVVVWKRGPKL
jgi:hypothetical protein